MAYFDLESFLVCPSYEQLDQCRKDYLFEIAQHFSFTVSKQMLKKDLKALVVDELVERGLLVLPVQSELAVSDAMPESLERQKHEAEPSAVQVEGGDGEDGGRFKAPFQLPRYDLSSPGSSDSREGVKLKVHLARLQLEAKDQVAITLLTSKRR
ncbi:hypothetical protein OYC64_015747 [Pagothenia borchgrevinki]|uniref:Uncharacterized protein n=1 Tax=Pagothenia borchgrevinki TaxID=8213 RepID=A0ABD2HI85_PAGBO